MTLAPGTRLGPYQVVSPLGAGGMGEVYRARDTRLGRDVAIKVLPGDVARDADRRARFEREAHAVAALSHPNILAIHDIGCEGDHLFVVTELLDGETLAERLTHGALPVRKAVELTVAIARGLSAAHGNGIAHRDLKPANIFLLADGQVKILDFGLARDISAASGATETQAALTDPGTVLGTAGYMAPEQIRGQATDGRADLFALGAVFYELLTGRRAFIRETTAETMTAVLREDPPELTTARADLPPALDRIVRHCLEKNPLERFQSARDVIFALDALSGSGSAVRAVTESRGRQTAPLLGWLTAGVLGIAAGATGLLLLRPAAVSSPAPLTRFTIAPPPGLTFRDLAVSPDGQSIAVMAYGPDARQLFVRRLGDDKLIPIDGASDAGYPFWSPDSRTIFFCDSVSLKQVPPGGGAVRVIAACTSPRTPGAFLPDGTLVYVPMYNGPVVFLNPESGAMIDEHSWTLPPHTFIRSILPLDTDRFLIVVRSHQQDPKDTGIFLANRDGETLRPVVAGLSEGVALVGEHLLYLRGDVLVAQLFDRSSGSVSGASVDIAQPVARFAASSTGTIAAFTSPRGLEATRRITWFSRDGASLSVIGEPSYLLHLAVSPNGRRLAVGKNSGVWVYDIARGVGGRAATDSVGVNPVWSRDGAQLANISIEGIRLTSLDRGTTSLFPSSRPGLEENPWSWTPDNAALIYSYSEKDGLDTVEFKTFAQGAPVPLMRVNILLGCVGSLSPNGKWIAYDTAESGRQDVYVRPFPGPGPAVQVSTAGGLCAVWRKDGQALFYADTKNVLTEVPVTPDGGSLQLGQPRALFQLKNAVKWNRLFDVSPDGQRFVMITESDPDPSPITTIVNWRPAAAR